MIQLDCESLKNKKFFDNFSHVNELRLEYGDYSDEDFVHLSKTQILYLNRFESALEFTGDGFCHLKKIKKITIDYGSLSPNSLIHLKNVEEIELFQVQNITNSSLSHLSNVKKVKIREHHDYPLTIEGYKNLKNCVSLSFPWNRSVNNEVIEHFSTMKNLKSLNVRYIGGLSSSSLSKLKNLTSLKIGSHRDELDDSFLEQLPNLRQLLAIYFLTDKGMKFLGKIETLYMEWCKEVTDESFKYLKSVKDLELEDMDQLTTKIIKILSKERKVMERVKIYYCKNLQNKDDWRKEMRIKKFD